MSPVEGAEEDAYTDVGVECILDMFREHSKVKLMLQEIPSVIEKAEVAAASQVLDAADSLQFAAEKAFEDLKKILDHYQEQPHLLDPHLEEFLGYLVTLVREVGVKSSSVWYRNTRAPKKAVATQAFKYIYLLIKVRGYKIVVNKLPHEVGDLLPVLEMLEQPYDESDDFYKSYVLLLWLSIVVYMPFNIADFDATTGAATTQPSEMEQEKLTMVNRLLVVIKQHLRSAQGSRDMAAFLASRLVTRPDLRDHQLPSFMEHCLQVLSTPSTQHRSTFHHLGCLRALGLVWKHGRRDELLPLSVPLLQRLQQQQHTTSPDCLIRKLAIKLVQRIGLTFLAPRLASWRYRRGNRSLVINMSKPQQQQLNDHDKRDQDEEEQKQEEEDVEVVPEIEDIIDQLLKGLKDTDTVVRWSSSKGVGRVCGRLSRDMASEVVSAVLSSFTPRDTHNTWHGGCLALAELGRRGLLLPDTLPEVVAVLKKAFVYDKLMGQCSVGANIRDAACYLCWSLARAYDPQTLHSFVNEFATGLLIVALFDREIPCRHAAAAAFQEHVGRQGRFPHGIEILTTVDYFAVGIRANAFLKLSPFVASFPEYSVALVDHLVEHKLTHWDTVVRELAAKTLHQLTQYCVQHCSSVVLQSLLISATGAVLVERHGAILALGNIISTLVNIAKKEGCHYHRYVGESVMSSISALVAELSGRRLLQGVGGTYMRLALADLIYHVATAGIAMHSSTTGEWLSLLGQSVVFVEEDVRTVSVKALSALWFAYFSQDDASALNVDTEDTGASSVNVDTESTSASNVTSDTGDSATGSCKKSLLPSEIIKKYLSSLSCERENYAQGMAMALGVLPRSVLKVHCSAVIRGLLSACLVTPETASWAATRRDAISSVVSIIHTMGLKDDGFSQELLDACMLRLLRCLEDYTTDRRGDVGAWVREAAVTAIQSILLLSVQQDSESSTNISTQVRPKAEHVCGAITRITQLAVERIDRTRKVAGNSLVALFHHKPSIPGIPDKQHITTMVLSHSWCNTVNWGSDRETFPVMAKLLLLHEYSPRLIMGFAYSLGGVSANLAQSSSDALDSHVTTLGESPSLADNAIAPTVAGFVGTLLDLLQDTAVHDRLSLPLLKTFEHFMTSTSLLDEVLEEDQALCERMLSCLKKECQGCHDYHKLVTISAVMCEMLRLNSNVTKPVMNQLLLFLGYQYPKVRTLTATALLTALQDYSPDLLERNVIPSEDVLNQLIEVLENTPWIEANLANVRQKRNLCCTLLGLPVPMPRTKP